MEIKEITNKKIWEEFISKYSPQSLFQSWNWGEVISKSIPTDQIWRIGLLNNNSLIGIALVCKVNAKRGKFLHLRHGPIFSSWNRKNLSFFFAYLKNLAYENGC